MVEHGGGEHSYRGLFLFYYSQAYPWWQCRTHHMLLDIPVCMCRRKSCHQSVTLINLYVSHVLRKFPAFLLGSWCGNKSQTGNIELKWTENGMKKSEKLTCRMW